MNKILPFIATVLILFSFNSAADTLVELICKAEKGDPGTQYRLGKLYFNGITVKQNHTTAIAVV